MATFARVNQFGFIETPYYKVKKGKITSDVDFLAADVEEIITLLRGTLQLKRVCYRDLKLLLVISEILVLPH